MLSHTFCVVAGIAAIEQERAGGARAFDLEPIRALCVIVQAEIVEDGR
jgi:hypothetical protein